LKPVTETPTDRSHYAFISLTYASLLAGTAYSARHKPLLENEDILPMSAATFALAKLLVHEKVETWVRAPFVEEDEHGKQPKGEGLRYAIGELFSCTRCIGAWSALGLVALRVHSPRTGRFVATVLAVSAGNDFMQSAFSALCARTNRLEQLHEAGAEPVRQPEGRFASPLT
jgi:hypothetical protein